MWGFIRKFIGGCVGFLCTLITLSQFFLGTQSYKDFAKKYSLPTEISLTVLIFSAIMIAILIFGIQLYRYLRNANKAKKAGKQIHRFEHTLRDDTFKLADPDFYKQYNSHKSFYEFIATATCDLCDNLAEFIREKTGKKFSVCIKLLQSAKVDGDDQLCSFTLCRSGHDKADREENGKKIQDGALYEREVFVPVDENTAFTEILNNEVDEGKPSIFACSNLLMLKLLNFILGKDEYMNPNKDYWKHYLSTIVVPIRINRRIVQYDYHGNGVEKYVTYGFLCIDHRWPISRALKNELSEYTKGFADAFFGLLYQTQKCDQKLIAKK